MFGKLKHVERRYIWEIVAKLIAVKISVSWTVEQMENDFIFYKWTFFILEQLHMLIVYNTKKSNEKLKPLIISL